jgi:hypothetical protein
MNQNGTTAPPSDLVSRVSGFFSGGGSSNTRTVVKIELQNLEPDAAAKIVEGLRRKHKLEKGTTARPVAVGISLQVHAPLSQAMGLQNDTRVTGEQAGNLTGHGLPCKCPVLSKL